MLVLTWVYPWPLWAVPPLSARAGHLPKMSKVRRQRGAAGGEQQPRGQALASRHAWERRRRPVHDAAAGRISRPIQCMPTGAVSGALVVRVEMRAAKCGGSSDERGGDCSALSADEVCVVSV